MKDGMDFVDKSKIIFLDRYGKGLIWRWYLMAEVAGISQRTVHGPVASHDITLYLW
jgi:hypothetical protein